MKPSKDYIRGFERACTLILGTKVKWTRADIELRAHVARKFFGKKRTKR